MTSDQVDRTMQLAADDAARPRTRRIITVLAVVSVVLAAAAIGLVLWLGGKSRDLEAALRSDGTGLRADVTALRDQVRGLGGTPVVPERGTPGPDGLPGADGRDGRDGTNGQNGTDGSTPPCLSEPPQCRGANGADGSDGQAGKAGQDGVAGKDGADGTNGTNGVDGRNGVDGQQGPPPAGWTWTDSDGRQQSCARNTGSPDSAPTYTCTAPSPEPTGLPILRSSP